MGTTTQGRADVTCQRTDIGTLSTDYADTQLHLLGFKIQQLTNS